MTATENNYFLKKLNQNDLGLAPLAGISDIAFRTMCLKAGAGLMFTEMVSAKGIYYGNAGTKELMLKHPLEHATGLQLFGSEEASMRHAVRLANASPFDFVDINMGCPVRKVTANGDGSALLKDPETARRVAGWVVGESALPVSAKIRLGSDSDHINVCEVACALEEAGVGCVTVHARTARQMYEGKADWEKIRLVTESVSIPVVANGDIVSEAAYDAVREITGCAGVMIGRAARGNPVRFDRRTAHKAGKPYEAPGIVRKMAAARAHFTLMLAYKSEKTACAEFRKHLAWYTKGEANSAKLRGQINTTATKEVFFALIDKIINA
jgi:nifR3 family TIM-barrel protein